MGALGARQFRHRQQHADSLNKTSHTHSRTTSGELGQTNTQKVPQHNHYPLLTEAHMAIENICCHKHLDALLLLSSVQTAQQSQFKAKHLS